MNRNNILITLITFLFFGFTSCQKEVTDPAATTPTTIPGEFTANVNGVSFVADKFTGASKFAGVIAVYGVNTRGQQIVLRVADSGVYHYSLDRNSLTNAGAYQLDSTSAAFTTNQGNTSAQSGGTLFITTIDTAHKTLSGIFSMNVYRQLDLSQKIITDGVFNNIPYQTSTTGASSTDTFRVKINGADYNPFSIIGVSLFGNISVSGTDQAGSKTVALTFPSTATPGTYSLANNFTYIGQYNPNSTTYLASDAGNLIILENNANTKRVRGSFDFHASPPFVGGNPNASLTAGYFSVKYQ